MCSYIQYLGLIGLFNMITLWPGFFLTPPSSIASTLSYSSTTASSSSFFFLSSSSSSPSTTNTLMTFNQIGFIVSFNLFTSAFVEIAWIWWVFLSSHFSHFSDWIKRYSSVWYLIHLPHLNCLLIQFNLLIIHSLQLYDSIVWLLGGIVSWIRKERKKNELLWTFFPLKVVSLNLIFHL